MKKDLGKEEITVEVDDLIQHQDEGSKGGNSGTGKTFKVSKNNIKLIVSLFLLVVLILMAVVHAHFAAVLVVGIALGTLLILINKKE